MAEEKKKKRDPKEYLFQYTATPEQRHENAVRAGRALAEKRKQYVLQREVLKTILCLECDDGEAVERLSALGLDNTFANAANLAVMRKAVRGDVDALRYIRDTIGEKPADTTQLALLDKPVGAQDLTKLSDAELEVLADRAAREETPLLPDGEPETAAALPEPVAEKEPAYDGDHEASE